MVDKSVIDEISKRLINKNMLNTVFYKCDTDNDACVSILDIKAGLIANSIDTPTSPLIARFIADLKKMFKTSMIDEWTFRKIFQLYGDAVEFREALLKLRDLFSDESTSTKTAQVNYR